MASCKRRPLLVRQDIERRLDVVELLIRQPMVRLRLQAGEAEGPDGAPAVPGLCSHHCLFFKPVRMLDAPQRSRFGDPCLRPGLPELLCPLHSPWAE